MYVYKVVGLVVLCHFKWHRPTNESLIHWLRKMQGEGILEMLNRWEDVEKKKCLFGMQLHKLILSATFRQWNKLLKQTLTYLSPYEVVIANKPINADIRHAAPTKKTRFKYFPICLYSLCVIIILIRYIDESILFFVNVNTFIKRYRKLKYGALFL